MASNATGQRERYRYPQYAYRRPPALDRGAVERHPVVIVGAGPVGLAAAADLASHNVRSIVIDEDNTVSKGSRAVCWAKRTLEILDRVGAADRMVAKGVVWQRGRIYHGEDEIYHFDLLPDAGHKMPAFINLQQYYVEEFLIDHLTGLGLTEFRWRNKVTEVSFANDESVALIVETPDGAYTLHADYVLATDGVHSRIRQCLDLAFEGRAFNERFLITDFHLKADFPTERRFWFEPVFHAGQSALLHRQPDDMWRIDLQLGPDADPEEEGRFDRVVPRIRKIFGEEADFDIEWTSVYTFSCRMLQRFRHGRIFFLGDSAHVVSPFGARGGNGGIQDADNLAWKLALVLDGQAPESLLWSYDDERVPAAEENLCNSARSTDFMTPKNQVSADFRRAVLSLSQSAPFARALVNSGRLSLPHRYRATPLSTPDRDDFGGLGILPGAPAVDAPVLAGNEPAWLLNRLGGRFVLMVFVDGSDGGASAVTVLADALAGARPAIDLLSVSVGPGAAALQDREGQAASRWGAVPGTGYLVRPDQHVAARWKSGLTPETVAAALSRAVGRGGATP